MMTTQNLHLTTLCLLFFALPTTFSPTQVWYGLFKGDIADEMPAEAPPTGMNLEWANDGESDYQLSFTWEYNPEFCDCGTQTTTVDLKYNTSTSTSGLPVVPSLTASDSADTWYVGPGATIDEWQLEFGFSGRRQWTGDGCTVFATCIADCDCDYTYEFPHDIIVHLFEAVTTQDIRPPSGVSATDGIYEDRVRITWTSETDIPDAMHQYRIYRDGSLLATVDGTERSYDDMTALTDVTYTYSVATYTDQFGTNTHESSTTGSGTTDDGYAFLNETTASDGDFYGRTKIEWSDLSASADDIRIERSIPNSAEREELEIMNPNATTFNDQTGIPGFVYTYYVTPLKDGFTFSSSSDDGHSRPNGTIKGTVKSTLGAGVSGVEIHVELLTTSIPAGGTMLPTNCVETYCATTDADGYYEIKDVYYYTEAEFRIYPEKGGMIPHTFSPDTIYRTLDENSKTLSAIDFQDLTVFTVGGRVTYPESNGTTCGVEGATILINDNNFGVTTDPMGYWDFAIQEEGDYTFAVEYLHHAFENPQGGGYTTLFIIQDSTEINFEDVTTDDLKVIVQGGCESSLGDAVQVQVTSPGGCFNELYETNADGYLLIEDLPARPYSVQVIDIFPFSANNANILDQIGNIPVEIDLTVRDTGEVILQMDTTIITPGDTIFFSNGDTAVLSVADTSMATLGDTVYMDIEPKVQFVYRSPLDISVDFEEAGAEVLDDCFNSEGENIILMQQGDFYVLNIVVKESLGEDCFIDTGFVKIYDFISDKGGLAQRIPIKGGIATYVIEAGEPMIAESPDFHNHEKPIYIIPEVDLVEPEPVEYWALVTGAKSNTPSFITRTPDIPMIILHDPPGDNSYAYIEEGEKFTSFSTQEVQIGGEAGFYTDLLLGAKWLTPFSGQGFGTVMKFSAVGGQDQFDRTGVYTTIEFTETFSTSDLDNLTGHDGDVYIGAAFNTEFSISEFLTFDTCVATVDLQPTIAVQDFATTFVYTEKHIRDVLIPTIRFLKDNLIGDRDTSDLDVEELAEFQNLIADEITWGQILDSNDVYRDSLAVFEENISFSAGASLTREYVSDTTTTVSVEYSRFVNSNFALGAKIDNAAGIWFDSELGVQGAFRYTNTINDGFDTTYTRKVGYVLDDGDIGDFFSVDILEDTIYSVPAFRLKLGTTSCPQEPGSQARDRADIQILPPDLSNVPVDGEANFLCRLTNLSESFETREYAVRVVSVTNPDGAVVRLGGQIINNGEATFFLERGQTLDVNLSIQKGPLASNYDSIGIMMYPPCEYALWQDNGTIMNGDTAYIVQLDFQSECTNVTLADPPDDWLLNQNDGNVLVTTLTGYDTNNPDFESLTIQVKKEGEGYVDQVTIDKEDLAGAFHGYQLSLPASTFIDGAYRVRAKAFCRDEQGKIDITYSAEKRGIIDRSSIAPFGTPSPSDGFLREGQDVFVTFDKEINCDLGSYPTDITLVRNDTGDPIPFTISCFNNQLVFTTSPHLTDQVDLEGVEVTASVSGLRDLSGNIQEYTTTWSFLVNVYPVFWDPEQVFASGYVGLEHSLTGILKNTALTSKTFSLDKSDSPLIDYPDWLMPKQTRGSVLPNNDFNVEFALIPDLTPGIYQGLVTALVDGLPVTMEVIFELLAKPVNWHFDPTSYEYSMNVIAQFSRNDSDTLLSEDTRDLIGAFVNGELRGVANMVYEPISDSHIAFLTVYSNNSQQLETIDFKFWYALNGIEYGALETIQFNPETVVGTVDNPFLLHPLGILQVIPLNQGWNWISLNVEDADMTRERIFQSILSSGNDIIVKSAAKTSEYSAGTGWQGNLQTLQTGKGYLLHLSDQGDTLRVVGYPPANDITVPVGSWTWLGFPRQGREPIASVLANLNPSNGDILKSQVGFSSYTASLSAWVGNVEYFDPGEGYKLFVANPGEVTFPASRSEACTVNPADYEFNMNVTGTFDPQLIGEMQHKDLMIVAFVNGQCRGIAEAEYVEALQGFRYYVLVHGGPADFLEEVTFKIVNQDTWQEYTCNGEPVRFSPDGITGYSWEPYAFLSSTTSVDNAIKKGYALMQNIPNPARGETLIRYRTPIRAEVRISLYNAYGERIETLSRETVAGGEHMVVVDVSKLAPGLYFYDLQANEVRLTKKMMIQ